MPVTDGEIVVMSYRKYKEMCGTIDLLMKRLKQPVMLKE